MTDYLVVFMPEAANDLRRLDKAVAQRIVHKLKCLSLNFNDLTPETLTGEFKEFLQASIRAASSSPLDGEGQGEGRRGRCPRSQSLALRFQAMERIRKGSFA